MATRSNISPAVKELENAASKVQELIKNKQTETQKIAEQIQNDYDGFINSIKNTPNTLVKDESFSTTISAPLFNTDTKIKTFLQKQENPNETYIKLNQTVIDGYVKALDAQTPAALNMTQATYNKSKNYLQDINNKIKAVERQQIGPKLIAYNDQTIAQPVITQSAPTSIKNVSQVNTNQSTPKVLLAQNTTPPCTSC